MDSKVYSGLSTLGNVETIYSTLMGTVVIIIFITVGAFLVKSKTVFTSKYTTNGIALEDSTCSRQQNVTSCSTSYSYMIPGDKNVYKGFSNSNSNFYNKGQSLIVYYDPKNHSHSQLEPDENTLIGWGLIGVGVFAFLLIVINAFITYKYKPNAAYQGAQSIFDFIFPSQWNNNNY